MNALLEDKAYLEAARKLHSLDQNLNLDDLDEVELSDCDPDQVKAFDAARNEVVHVEEHLHTVLGEKFDHKFKILAKVEGGEGSEILLTDVDDRQELEQLIQAMRFTDMLSYR